MGLQDPRPSGARSASRDRDHHRPAGPGICQCGGNGAGGTLAGATFNRPGPHGHRSSHLRVRRRRLHDGRHFPRSRIFAGKQQLGKLIAIYDDNGISIDGKVVGWFDDDTARRFEAYGWHVLAHVDGQSSESVAAAICRGPRGNRQALVDLRQDHHRLWRPEAGHATMHGEAMGDEEIAAARKNLGWTSPPFEIPGRNSRRLGQRERARAPNRNGEAGSPRTRRSFRRWPRELERRMAGDLPAGFADLS